MPCLTTTPKATKFRLGGVGSQAEPWVPTSQVHTRLYFVGKGNASDSTVSRSGFCIESIFALVSCTSMITRFDPSSLSVLLPSQVSKPNTPESIRRLLFRFLENAVALAALSFQNDARAVCIVPRESQTCRCGDVWVDGWGRVSCLYCDGQVHSTIHVHAHTHTHTRPRPRTYTRLLQEHANYF